MTKLKDVTERPFLIAGNPERERAFAAGCRTTEMEYQRREAVLVDKVKAAEELLEYDGYTSPQATAKGILKQALEQMEE